MLILALDPGKTTGACAIRTDGSKKGFVVVTALEIPWESRLGTLEALIDGTFFDKKKPQPPEAIVVESFHLRQGRAYEQAGSDFPSSQVIGSIQAFLWLDREMFSCQRLVYGLERLYLQEPVIIARVRIDDPDLPVVQGSPHKQDAYKHAKFYFCAHVREWR